MQLKIASYNIHKGVGLDRKRDPDRILSVLAEIDADIVALQECDRRFGRRGFILQRERAALRRVRPPFAAIHTPVEFIRLRSLALLK